MDNIGIGLELLVVGMCTVFVILIIVIWGGKLLINIVNKIAPEEAVAPKKAQKAAPLAAIDTTTMAVIEEAVSKITAGKGRIASVKKV
ncbi:MAG: OadG family protein [Prevotellaceae bacterium]|nr:OadG family protein [Prevotellaceae bacterium]